MLIPIIKESEKEFEKKLPELIHDLVWEASDGGYNLPVNHITSYQGEENRSYTDVKDLSRSSRLALLEGVNKIAKGIGEEISLVQFLELLQKDIDYIKSGLQSL